jgi:hypothetical protein
MGMVMTKRLPPEEQAEIAAMVHESYARGDPVEIEEAEDLARRFGVMSDKARDEEKLLLSEERYE